MRCEEVNGAKVEVIVQLPFELLKHGSHRSWDMQSLTLMQQWQKMQTKEPWELCVGMNMEITWGLLRLSLKV